MAILLFRSISKKASLELRLAYLMPFFLATGLLVNSQIASAAALRARDFAPVAVHASRYADYSRDKLGLQFAPIDPSIIDAAQLDTLPDPQAPDLAIPVGATPTPQLQGTPTPQPTATQNGSEPTPPGPTPPPLLPTLAPIIPTLVPIVPTLVPIVPTLAEPIIDLIPTLDPSPPCIPLPLIPC